MEDTKISLFAWPYALECKLWFDTLFVKNKCEITKFWIFDWLGQIKKVALKPCQYKLLVKA